MKILKTLTVLLAVTASLNAQAATHSKDIQRCESSSECLKLTEVLYYEARGETKEGIIAVGQVVLNRSIRKSADIVEIVEQKKLVKTKLICQFSYVCEILENKLQESLPDENTDNLKVIAQGILDNKFPDYAQGADHFFNESINLPNWSKNMTQVAYIGKHLFFDSTKQI